MPALAKAHRILPRFVPHSHGAAARAGAFSNDSKPSPIPPLDQRPSESLDRLAHDARNVLSGLMLYSELLAAPGVLNSPHGHYAEELDGMVQTAARIFEKIVAASAPKQGPPKFLPIRETEALPTATTVPLAPVPVTDIAAELRHLQPLLTAIAGPAVRLSVATMPCPGRTALAVEDLTRVLINLVRNASDAMPGGGHVRITAQYHDGLSFAALLNDFAAPATGSVALPRAVLLTVSDNGPGVPESVRDQVFDLGFSTRKESANWPAPRRRGLGLSIVRNLVETAGGSINLTASHTGGARFEIVLPLDGMVTSGTHSVPPTRAFSADSRREGCIECE
ncbi:MAG TPA: ATP-binding protein, partial [Acidobacteriaceae bacterium]|nr:ATP-binding protein [Acidobacteriaceae bacterium]